MPPSLARLTDFGGIVRGDEMKEAERRELVVTYSGGTGPYTAACFPWWRRVNIVPCASNFHTTPLLTCSDQPPGHHEHG